jgi:serine/threonine protein kinase
LALNSGSTVGHYQILGLLGAGGMGEVYRARDTKLGREVALKILPDAVSADAERRARFAREARSLAALNHTNIAQVYGFEDGEPISALIMELIDGEDLSSRIRRGPIPFDEAIAIARQIGDALQAAHDRGIIHRDLKPANIKVKDDGTVKVLDFGLAKALDPGTGMGEQGPGELSHSPTITSPAMTLRGMILGTAAYMSPEQAKGRVVDKRADIWAFGCVLYEMLTGRRAFAGDDVSDTLAAILKSDLDWNGVPPRAVRLLKKCVEKDPRKRLHDIGDAWDLIEDQPHAAAAPARTPWLPWSLAALFALSTIGFASLRFVPSVPVPPNSARFQIVPPPKQEFGTYLTLSPDGRRVAFTASDASRISTLWLRDLDSLEARMLPGTENATSPFWSPDGRYIAFGDGRTLKKVDVSGGPPQKIGDSPGAAVGIGAWNSDNVIVVGTRGVGPLYRVAAAGGTLVPLTSLGDLQSVRGHSFPVFLPDQKRFLYMILSGSVEQAGVYLGSLDSTPDQQITTRLLPLAYGPLAIAGDGQGLRLLFFRDGTVMSQPFDADRAQLTGDAQPVAERVGSAGSFGFFGVAGDVLIYRTGTSATFSSQQLTWHDRAGNAIAKIGEPLAIASGPFSVTIAPDGRRAAVMIAATTPSADLWLVEFARGLATRLTSSAGSEVGPVWSPDSRRLAFRSSRTDNNLSFDVFITDVDGTEGERTIAPQPTAGLPNDWSVDGRTILLVRGPDLSASDIFAWSTDRKVAEPLLQTAFAENSPRLSSDGRWLAYVSNESGASEVYVRPFSVSADGKAAVGSKWRVSTNGGTSPRWRRDGKELFFRSGIGDFMAVDVKTTDDSIETTLPRRLFANSAAAQAWDVAADGQRFLISNVLSGPLSPAVPDPITVVLNWQAMLQR